MKAYSYLRVSSPEQAKDTKDGINRQIRLAETYCEREGIELSRETFRDLGVSAFKGHNKDPRSALSAFIQGVDLGKIPTPCYLIIERLDRLSREDVISALNLLQSICERGVTIVTVADGKKYTAGSIKSGLSDIMVLVLSFALGYEESVKKKDRLKESWSAAREKAERGIKVKTSYPSWLNLKGNEFSIIEDRANQIKLMFDWFINKGWGYKSISNYLNKMGEKTVNGLPWYPQIVKNLLKNPAVIGEFHPGTRVDGKRVKTGTVIKDYFPAIVSEEDFYTVKNRLSIHPSRVGKPQKGPANIFEGLFKCGYCGGTMGLFHSSSLICWNAFNSQTCVRHSWNVFDYEIPLLMELSEVIQERKSELNQPLAKEIESLESKVIELTNRIGGFMDMAEKLTDKTDVIKRIQIITYERENIRKSIVDKKALLAELSSVKMDKDFDFMGMIRNQNPTERLQVQRLMKKHLLEIKVFPAGEPAINDEFRRLRDKMVGEGKNVHSVNKTLVTRLGIKEHRYMEVTTRNPIVRKGKKVSCFKVVPVTSPLTLEQIKAL